MKPGLIIEGRPLEPKEREDGVAALKKLLNGAHAGILSTVDECGIPRSRWMATIAFDDFPRFYTITAPTSRKIDEINNHPMVNWMFANEDMTFVVNLLGKARVMVRDVPAMKRIWKQFKDKSRAYFLGSGSEGVGFAIIETQVELVECTLPIRQVKFQLEIEDIVARWGQDALPAGRFEKSLF